MENLQRIAKHHGDGRERHGRKWVTTKKYGIARLCPYSLIRGMTWMLS